MYVCMYVCMYVSIHLSIRYVKADRKIFLNFSYIIIMNVLQNSPHSHVYCSKS